MLPLNYGRPAFICEVCGAKTAHNIVCTEIAMRLINGTYNGAPHPKHACCRTCEEALTHRHPAQRDAFEAVLRAFPYCPDKLSENDKIMMVLGR